MLSRYRKNGMEMQQLANKFIVNHALLLAPYHSYDKIPRYR